MDPELAAAERQLAEKCEELRRATRTTLTRTIAKLSLPAFEQLVWLLLDRLGHRDISLVRRLDKKSYFTCLRASLKLVVAVCGGAIEDGKEAVQDLRAEIQKNGARAGMLFANGTIAESALGEARESGPPLSLYDAGQIAELCASRSLGVIRAQMPVEYYDIEFFADLLEG